MTDGTAHRFFRNVKVLTLSNVLYRIISIGVAVYLARELGASVLGQYAQVMNVLTLFLAFADVGVTNFVIMEVSQHRQLSQLYLSNFFFLQLLTGATTIILIMGTGFASGYSTLLLSALFIGSFGPFFSGLSTAYNAVLSAHEYLHPFGIIELICMTVFFAGNLFVVLLHGGLLALVAVTVLVAVVKVILGRRWITKLGLTVRFAFDRMTLQKLLRYGFPFLLINGAHFAIQRLDVLFLSWSVADVSVGLYAAASRLIFASLFFISATSAALYPVFSRIVVTEHARAQQLFHRGNRYFLILSFAVALFFYFSAPIIVQVLYGESYRDSIAVLQILAWFVPLFSLGVLPSNVLMVGGGVWKAAVISIFSLIIIVVAESMLIPLFGLTGAAIGVLIAEAVAMVLFYIFALHELHFHVSVRCVLGIPTTAALALGAGLILTPLHPGFQFIIVLSIYFSVLLAFGNMSVDDIHQLQMLFQPSTRELA